MNLYDYSWQVDESTYRADKALSYSNLSTFLSVGFEGLDHLFDKKTSPSLTFGSAVDTLLTDGEESYNERFIVMPVPELSDKADLICATLLERYGAMYSKYNELPSNYIIGILDDLNYGKTWRETTRLNKMIELEVDKAYNTRNILTDKEIISEQVDAQARACVEKLRTDKATSWYFQQDNPFDGWKRYYQLKFKANLGGYDYRCMADLILVSDELKTIIPCDLKTGSVPEWRFPENFIKWHYQCQGRLYPRVMKEALKGTPYATYTWKDYRFIYICKSTMRPLVWEFPYTYSKGKVAIGNVTFEDPEAIGKELYGYLETKPEVPADITIEGTNNIAKWILNHQQ